MNPNRDPAGILVAIRGALGGLGPSRGPAGAIVGILAAALVLGLVLLPTFGPGSARGDEGLVALKAGKVADSDIIADREISYVDQHATDLRIQAEERLVLPIFVVDEKPATGAIERLGGFQDLISDLAERKLAGDTLFMTVQSRFPGLVTRDDAISLVRSPFRAQALSHADSILRRLLENGIAAVPESGLEQYNADYVELRRLRDGKPESEELPAGRLVTLRSLGGAIDSEASARRLARPMSALVATIVRDFAVENAFFDSDQSARRLASVRDSVEPVVRTIARGERLVRKGEIIGDAEAARIAAVVGSVGRTDWGVTAGSAGLLVTALILGVFLLGRTVFGATLRRQEQLLVALSAVAYFGICLAAGRLSGEVSLKLSFMLPTALFCMLLAILAGPRHAALYCVVLSLLAQSATGLDSRLLAFSLVSGAAATFVVRSARSRIDLVRAGAVLALFEGVVAAFLAAAGSPNLPAIGGAALGGAANGFGCSILALAVLPVIEQALNSPTRFRMMELSDLNAPILKRLLTVAPGTYSHSVTVAHLAESASREIGADPLLARVGAYYHDIGKIEQPEYFIENQSGYNKHDEINPRLSATVIRSHVKLGAEKARGLGLPEAVVDIISQHHGNGVITWFLDQARKTEAEADADDFAYPGQPPSSREAAVVMLADSVEAATRSLKRPTMSRLEDFIREIILEKVKQGQLDRCDLTFKDLETIRTSFTRILAGHFHSRMEYPKLREQTR